MFSFFHFLLTFFLPSFNLSFVLSFFWTIYTTTYHTWSHLSATGWFRFVVLLVATLLIFGAGLRTQQSVIQIWTLTMRHNDTTTKKKTHCNWIFHILELSIIGFACNSLKTNVCVYVPSELRTAWTLAHTHTAWLCSSASIENNSQNVFHTKSTTG